MSLEVALAQAMRRELGLELEVFRPITRRSADIGFCDANNVLIIRRITADNDADDAQIRHQVFARALDAARPFKRNA